MTYDQGREMAEHQRLTEVTGVKVYFAAPLSCSPRPLSNLSSIMLRFLHLVIETASFIKVVHKTKT